MEAVAQLLRSTIGLDASSIGMASVERAVLRRMEATRCDHPAQYQQLVRNSPAELAALIEVVVVPETWFFRDPGAFTAVAREALRSGTDAQLRFLCVPCSSGEEPFSLAMALLDAGVSPGRFHIEAVDISRRVLEDASRAIYGRNSFRGRDLAFRDRYFAHLPEGYQLHLAVRNLVGFRQANILAESALPGAEVYHAIFCRNLLIYFDEETQNRAIQNLKRLLRPDGLLCVAPAESALLLRHGFEPARLPMAFAFRKQTAGTSGTKGPLQTASRSRPSALQSYRLKPPLVQRKAAPAIDHAPAAPAAPSVADATRLANEGRLEEVAAICHALIAAGSAPAHAYYLLALVYDAGGRADEAAELYRKALYLEPQHREALAHYSLLAAKRGDLAAAKTLQDRARRLSTDAA